MATEAETSRNALQVEMHLTVWANEEADVPSIKEMMQGITDLIDHMPYEQIVTIKGATDTTSADVQPTLTLQSPTADWLDMFIKINADMHESLQVEFNNINYYARQIHNMTNAYNYDQATMIAIQMFSVYYAKKNS
ncbi:MAG: hypothetical protein COA78_28465 [Blastopirellula sp.]|nr:MAG: hypothetical protein COA78_28465 [Blastopirellula sp.]